MNNLIENVREICSVAVDVLWLIVGHFWVVLVKTVSFVLLHEGQLAEFFDRGPL